MKLLVGGEDCPLFEGAVLYGGAEPLLVPAFLALCAIDNLSTNKGNRTVIKSWNLVQPNLDYLNPFDQPHKHFNKQKFG